MSLQRLTEKDLLMSEALGSQTAMAPEMALTKSLWKEQLKAWRSLVRAPLLIVARTLPVQTTAWSSYQQQKLAGALNLGLETVTAMNTAHENSWQKG